jgi:hypothetical protein
LQGTQVEHRSSVGDGVHKEMEEIMDRIRLLKREAKVTGKPLLEFECTKNEIEELKKFWNLGNNERTFMGLKLIVKNG